MLDNATEAGRETQQSSCFELPSQRGEGGSRRETATCVERSEVPAAFGACCMILRSCCGDEGQACLVGAQDSTFHEAEAAPQDWNCTSGVVIQPPHALEAHDLELPSDSLAALLLLRAQFPRTEVGPQQLPRKGGVTGVSLQHQL